MRSLENFERELMSLASFINVSMSLSSNSYNLTFDSEEKLNLFIQLLKQYGMDYSTSRSSGKLSRTNYYTSDRSYKSGDT